MLVWKIKNKRVDVKNDLIVTARITLKKINK